MPYHALVTGLKSLYILSVITRAFQLACMYLLSTTSSRVCVPDLSYTHQLLLLGHFSLPLTCMLNISACCTLTLCYPLLLQHMCTL